MPECPCIILWRGRSTCSAGCTLQSWVWRGEVKVRFYSLSWRMATKKFWFLEYDLVLDVTAWLHRDDRLCMPGLSCQTSSRFFFLLKEEKERYERLESKSEKKGKIERRISVRQGDEESFFFFFSFFFTTLQSTEIGFLCQSVVTGCIWVTCIQWRQRTNFTAPVCIHVGRRLSEPLAGQPIFPTWTQVSAAPEPVQKSMHDAHSQSQCTCRFYLFTW